MATVKLARYTEWAPSNMNAALSSLQTLYEANSNAPMIVANALVAADTDRIDIPVSVGVYRYLHLILSYTQPLAGIGTGPYLQVNGDGQANYDYGDLITDGSGFLTNFVQTSFTGFALGAADQVNIPTLVDWWLFLTSTGLNMLGRGTTLFSGASSLNTYWFRGTYRGNPVRSIELRETSGIQIFAAGSRYRLEGYLL